MKFYFHQFPRIRLSWPQVSGPISGPFKTSNGDENTTDTVTNNPEHHAMAFSIVKPKKHKRILILSHKISNTLNH